MIALSGDEIYMNWYSTCSPIDVQMEVSHDNELEEWINIKINKYKEPIKIECNNKLYEYFIKKYPEKKFILIK